MRNTDRERRSRGRPRRYSDADCLAAICLRGQGVGWKSIARARGTPSWGGLRERVLHFSRTVALVVADARAAGSRA